MLSCAALLATTPPETTFSLTGRPNTPLAVATINLLASAPSDISITVADDATLMTSSLPSSLPLADLEHSAQHALTGIGQRGEHRAANIA